MYRDKIQVNKSWPKMISYTLIKLLINYCHYRYVNDCFFTRNSEKKKETLLNQTEYHFCSIVLKYQSRIYNSLKHMFQLLT